MPSSDQEAARYRAAQELLALALERPEPQRADFVVERCGNDPSLLSEVLSLLAADARSGGFLDGPALTLADALENPIGCYRLLRPIGQGGTSVVYLAVREDGRVRQRVALKLVKPGMQSSQMLRRFRQERHILAALSHPNIARLLDAGESADGRPYFVLEHVEGEPIDAYCERRALGLAERLGLFSTVCRAVHYAHQNLVVHRDLKPENIVVTAAGVPKLLDFGIAKLVNPEIYDAAFGGTTVDLQPMTVRYASPEQVSGGHITTAADVYSLGVLLYLLLAAKHPYELASPSVLEMSRVIREYDPPPPSAALGPRERRARGLSHELDTVVRMAMHKEPARRYPSALELGRDVDRYVAGLPVAARGDSVAYRARKLAQRHVGVVIAGGLALASVIAAVAGVAWQATNAVRAQARAEQERRRAQEVSDFLVDLFKVSAPNEPQVLPQAARLLLERGANRVRASSSGDREVRAALLHSLGVAYLNAGAYREAVGLLSDALALRRRALGDADPAVADSLLALGRAREELGERGPAMALYAESLRVREEALGKEHPLVAKSLLALAQIATGLDGAGAREAETLLRRALSIRTAHFGPSSPEVAEVEDGLSIWLYTRGRYDEAERLARHAADNRQLALGDRHPDVAVSLNDLAIVLWAQGRHDEAEGVFLRAYDIMRPALGDEHPDVIDMRSSMAVIWREQGRLAEAEARQRESLEKRRAVRGEDHPAVDNALHALGATLFLEGRYDEALEFASRALAMRRARYAGEHRSVAESLALMGRIYLARGEAVNADRLLREAIGLWDRLVGPDHPTVAAMRTDLGRALAAQGRDLPAQALLTEALDRVRATLLPGHPAIADALIGLAEALMQTSPGDATPLLRQALDLRLAALGPAHWRTAQARSLLGAALVRDGESVLGARLLREGWMGLGTALGEAHPETKKARARLGELTVVPKPATALR